MTKVRGPRFNPGWLPVFHSSLNIFLSLFIMRMYMYFRPVMPVYVHVYASMYMYKVQWYIRLGSSAGTASA